MVLDHLTLQNFRSYRKSTVEFSPGTTTIVGPNGAGKTNLLEALVLLATGRSFRADEDREAVRWGSEVSSVRCQVSSEEEKTNLEMRITRGEVAGQKAPIKKYFVNGVPRRQIDFVGTMKVVLFWPEHLELVTDSPSLRRRYLDSVLVQTDREYRRNVLSYERGLRQRNKLLDQINEGAGDRRQLVFWDQLLIKSGGYITDVRRQFIDFVNGFQVAGTSYHIEYDKSVISDSRLAQYRDEEVAAKATLVGPHRDDFRITTHNLDLSKFGSRGEQRLAVLWLKLAELAYVENVTGSRPILLLDDIFSELDAAHRKLVVDVVASQQTVLTSANEGIIKLMPQANNIHL
jgi:DNA replication and repair protein RecF